MRITVAVGLSLLSGILAFLSFTPNCSFFSYVFLIPILYSISICSTCKLRYITVLLFLVIWNILTFNFINSECNNVYVNSLSFFGVVLISVSKVIPFIPVIHNFKYRFIYFACLWILIEYYWMNSSICFPFSTLGITLSDNPSTIKWYQYTGVLGGSIWVVVFNLYLHDVMMKCVNSKTKCNLINFVMLFVLLFVPLILSLSISSGYKNQKMATINILSLNNKTSELNAFDTCLTMCLNNKMYCDYTLFPEMSLFSYNELPYQNNQVKLFVKEKHRYLNNQSFIFGFNLVTWCNQKNLAVYVDPIGVINYRYKQVLVPFGESVPFKWLLENNYFIKKHRRYSYLSMENTSDIFTSKGGRIFTAICYEGFFETFLSSKISNGAECIFIIAKDPFPFSNHYNHLVKLLGKTTALTFQKYVVRSSWGGTSYIINPRGEVLYTNYNKSSSVSSKVYFNNKQTFFCKCKYNYIYIGSFILLAFIVLVYFVDILMKYIIRKK